MDNVKLKVIGLAKFNSSEYLRLMRMTHSELSKTGIDLLNIQAVEFSLFGQKIELFTDLFARSKAFSETDTLQSLDKTRDAQWVYFINAIRNAEKSPIAAEREAYQALLLEIKPYIGKQNVAMQLQTELCNGLLFDMAKEVNQPYIQTLRLEAVLQALQEANENFDALFIQRNVKKQTEQTPSLLELRKEIDVLYTYCTDRLTATHTLASSEAVKNCILQINGFIDSVTLLYNRRTSKPKEKESTGKE